MTKFYVRIKLHSGPLWIESNLHVSLFLLWKVSVWHSLHTYSLTLSLSKNSAFRLLNFFFCTIILSISVSVFLFFPFVWIWIVLSLSDSVPGSLCCSCCARRVDYPHSLPPAIPLRSLPNSQSTIVLSSWKLSLQCCFNIVCKILICSGCPTWPFTCSFILFVYLFAHLSLISVHQCPCWTTCARLCFTQMKLWRLRPCTCGSNCSGQLGARRPSPCPLPSETECASCCCRPWPMPAPPNSSTTVLVREKKKNTRHVVDNIQTWSWMTKNKPCWQKRSLL